MPTFSYSCSKCELIFSLFHHLGAEIVCPQCSGPVERYYQIEEPWKMPERSVKPGDVVKRFISEAREDHEEEKRNLKGNR